MIKYKTSKLTRIFTLGINRYAFKIDRGLLYKLELFNKVIEIQSIDTISYDLIFINNMMAYVYILTNKKGQKYQFMYSLLDGKTYQKMFFELLRINKNIKLDQKMIAFLESEITDIEFKFDFKVKEGNYWKRDKQFAQKYPDIDAFIGLIIVFFILPIPALLGFLGHKYLLEMYGENYEMFRLIAVIASGVSFSVLLTNLFISLVSMYLGHKLTFISLSIALLGLYFGLIY